MKTKGFTLIELMIVVAIIGILAAVIAPHFQDKGSKMPIGSRINGGSIETPCDVGGVSSYIKDGREVRCDD